MTDGQDDIVHRRRSVFPVAATLLMLAVLVSIAIVFLRPDVQLGR